MQYLQKAKRAMRAVVQRVKWARVSVEQTIVGQIDQGLLVLLGAGEGDTDKDVEYLAKKIVYLRVFEDKQQQMNCSLLDIGGALLVVSQFTLYGDCRKGRRPSFIRALEPHTARQLYHRFSDICSELGVSVATGQFGAMMEVELNNDGPVTLLLDSKKAF